MQLPVSRPLCIAALGGGLLLLIGLGVRAGASADSSPIVLVAAPVSPIVPAPVPPVGHHVRYQNLLPVSQPIEKGSEPGKRGLGAKAEPEKMVEAGPELSLGQCIAVAVDRQPTLKAVQASMATSEAGYRSLTNFGTVGTIISPDLDVRKQQAQRGLAAASGEYQKAYNELVQDVTRLYYSAVYAKQQEEVTEDVIGTLKELIKLVEDILKNAKNPADLGGLNTGKLRTMQIGLREAQILNLKAVTGRKRAMAALRQVMAVDDKCFPFRVKDAELPLMAQKVPITKDLVVQLAVERRPELALAAAAVDVFRLEVYAQGKIPFKRVVPTFASGADLHAKEIPQASRTKEYRPGGIIPEMPTQLVGSKFDRVNRAMGFSQKADAVFESARGLITLEAEDAFYALEEATEKLIFAKEKYDVALDLRKRVRDSAESIKEKDQIVSAEIVAAKAQSDYYEAAYEHLLALAALERITAGGIRPEFPGR